MVQGVGSGNSLIAKASNIASAAAKGQTAKVCSSLKDFINEVRAQTGKKVPTDTAAQLLEQATGVEGSQQDADLTTKCENFCESRDQREGSQSPAWFRVDRCGRRRRAVGGGVLTAFFILALDGVMPK